MDDHVSYPWTGRLAERWGHFGAETLAAAIVGVILIGLRPLDGALALTVPLALLAFVVATWVMMRRHDRRLCEHCMATMPLNPAAVAERYARRFWVTHAGSEPRLVIPYLAALVAVNFVPGALGRVAWTLLQLSMIYLVLSYATHRRLQPWCPWCRDDGGGGDDDPVSPDPVPGDRRQLV